MTYRSSKSVHVCGLGVCQRTKQKKVYLKNHIGCFFTCSPRPPTLSQCHMDLHVWAYPLPGYIFQVSSKCTTVQAVIKYYNFLEMQIWRIFKYKTRCSRSKQTLPPVLPPGNLDETRLSVVWSVLPSSELDETYASSLILSYSLHYMITWRHPQNRKYITLHCHQRRTKKWPYVARTANLVKFGLFFSDMQADRDKQTDTHTCWF